MTRVILHAGFHKTGTTSLQSYLDQHRADFAHWFSYHGAGDFPGTGARARIYAQHPFRWRLAAFRRSFRRFLAALPQTGTIVLSRENFSGAMPGHHDWRGRMLREYQSAAVPLLRVVQAELERRFGPAVEIELLFTTRARAPWIASVYGHLLRSIHLTESHADFAEQLAAMPELDTEARAIAAAVGVPVTIRTLEALSKTRPGPAHAVLERAGVPQAVWQALPPAQRANPGQSPELTEAFLALNRSGKPKPDLKRLKEKMIAATRGAR